MKNKDYVYAEETMIHKLREIGLTNGWEVMLYCKILSMSNKIGYCTATNRYFANFLGMTPRNVQRYISEFSELGIIKTFEQKNGAHTESRKIYPQLLENTELEEVEEEDVEDDSEVMGDKKSVDKSDETPDKDSERGKTNQERIEHFNSLCYEAKVNDNELPRIVALTYKQDIDHEIYDDKYARDFLIKRFVSSGFYEAKEEPMTELIDAVIKGEIVFEK